MFPLPSKDLDEAEDQNESGTRFLFAQKFTGEDFSTPHSIHQKSSSRRGFWERPQTMPAGLHSCAVDESFSSPTRKEPISDALKAREQSREGVGAGWTGFQALGS